MHADELEEMEYELHADADYRNEVFGDEARLLAREDAYDFNPDEVAAIRYVTPFVVTLPPPPVKRMDPKWDAVPF